MSSTSSVSPSNAVHKDIVLEAYPKEKGYFNLFKTCLGRLDIGLTAAFSTNHFSTAIANYCPPSLPKDALARYFSVPARLQILTVTGFIISDLQQVVVAAQNNSTGERLISGTKVLTTLWSVVPGFCIPQSVEDYAKSIGNSIKANENILPILSMVLKAAGCYVEFLKLQTAFWSQVLVSVVSFTSKVVVAFDELLQSGAFQDSANSPQGELSTDANTLNKMAGAASNKTHTKIKTHSDLHRLFERTALASLFGILTIVAQDHMEALHNATVQRLVNHYFPKFGNEKTS